MTNRHESRTKAYRYIIEQVKKGNLGPGHDIEETLADVDYISLGDLVKLKEGLVDPSPELAAALKKLLRPVASGTEIDDHLVTPFLPEK